MDPISQRKRTRKRLLVAALGVASISYVSTQSGCAPDADFDEESGASTAAYDDEQEPSADPQQAKQALSIRADTQLTAPDRLRPPVGNLLPPPVGNLLPPPVGNLVAPPVVRPIPIPIPFPPGNLMAPPPHEFEIKTLEVAPPIDALAPAALRNK
jgi:hypothetical protein